MRMLVLSFIFIFIVVGSWAIIITQSHPPVSPVLVELMEEAADVDDRLERVSVLMKRTARKFRESYFCKNTGRSQSYLEMHRRLEELETKLCVELNSINEKIVAEEDKITYGTEEEEQ